MREVASAMYPLHGTAGYYARVPRLRNQESTLTTRMLERATMKEVAVDVVRRQSAVGVALDVSIVVCGLLCSHRPELGSTARLA